MCRHVHGEGDRLTDSVQKVLEITGAQIFKAMDIIENIRSHGRGVTEDFYAYKVDTSTVFSLASPKLLTDTVAFRNDVTNVPDRERIILSGAEGMDMLTDLNMPKIA